MIRRPGQVVNDGLHPEAPELPLVEGFDLALSVDNVSSWGGDAALYRHFLGRALSTDAAARSTASPLPQTLLALAAIAGWRAGVLELRHDALARLASAMDSGSVGRPVLAEALGLQDADLDEFVRDQSQSPFGWPARADGDVVVARIGGFRGLGGPWTAPPARTAPIPGAPPGSGHFHITLADTEVWRLDADIFGSRLSRLTDVDESVENDADEGHADDPERTAASDAWPTRLAVFDTSYLAWLVLEKAP